MRMTVSVSKDADVPYGVIHLEAGTFALVSLSIVRIVNLLVLENHDHSVKELYRYDTESCIIDFCHQNDEKIVLLLSGGEIRCIDWKEHNVSTIVCDVSHSSAMLIAATTNEVWVSNRGRHFWNCATETFVDTGILGVVTSFLLLELDGKVQLLVMSYNEETSAAHRICPSSDGLICSVPLPRGSFINNSVVLGQKYVLLFSGLLVHVLCLTETGISPSASVELGIVEGICTACVSNPRITDEADETWVFALASNNSDIYLCTYSHGSITCKRIGNGGSQVFGITMDSAHGILVASSEGLKYFKSDPVVMYDIFTANFPPFFLTQLAPGQSIICGGAVEELTGLSIFKDDVAVKRECVSDQMFRGCLGLWMLRRFKSETHHSFMAVSFVESTYVLQLNGGHLEDITEYSGVCAQVRSLAFENAEFGSFIIQVTPNAIIILKSNITDAANDSAAEYAFSEDFSPYIACIMNDHVFALDIVSSKLAVFKSALSRGSVSISKLFEIELPFQATCLGTHTLLTADGGSALLAVAGGNKIACWKLFLDNIAKIEEYRVVLARDLDLPDVNEILMYKGNLGLLLAVGTRDGRVLTFALEAEGECINMTMRRCFSVGCKPVQLTRVKIGDHYAAFVVSGQISLLTEAADGGLEIWPVLPKGNHIAHYACPGEGPPKFVAIEAESLSIFSSSLTAAPRFELVQAVPGVKALIPAEKRAYVVLISLLGKSQVCLVRDDETILRSSLTGLEITCAAFEYQKFDHLYVGLQVGTVGQLRLLRLPNAMLERTQAKRRFSLPLPRSSHGAGSVPQFVFIADVGFPHPVSSVVPIEENICLVVAGPELHKVRFNATAETMSIEQTVGLRSEIRMARVSPSGKLLALVTDRTGLEILKLDDISNLSNLVNVDPFPASIEDLVFCCDQLIIAIDRRGLLVVYTIVDGRLNEKQISPLPAHDIPTALARVSASTVIFCTVSGAAYSVNLESQ